LQAAWLGMGGFEDLLGYLDIGTSFLYIAVFVASLCLVIFIHEMGHYTAARLCGVRIDGFSIGFGKEITGLTDRRGTRWSLSWILLGGYIKIFGDVDPQDPHIWDHNKAEKRPMTEEERAVAFFTKPLWQRTFIVLAGPSMNILFTLLLLIVVFATIGESSTRPFINAIAEGTAGYEAGFQLGDEVLAINGQPVVRFEDVWEYSKPEAGVPLVLTVKRNGEVIEVPITPRQTAYRDRRGVERSHGRLGITNFAGVKFKEITSVDGVPVERGADEARAFVMQALGREARLGILMGADKRVDIFHVYLPAEANAHLENPESEDFDTVFTASQKEPFYVPHSPGKAVEYAFRRTAHILGEGVKILRVLLLGKGEGDDQVGGAGSIGYMAGKAVESGLFSYITFIAVLSAQIGFINLLPIPVLDGGYLLFYLYEALARKPVPEKVKEISLIGGLIFLFVLMIVANISDILRVTHL
jgi:regulator of sigma E protease